MLEPGVEVVVTVERFDEGAIGVTPRLASLECTNTTMATSTASAASEIPVLRRM